jgi:hypothetical protein
MSTRFSLAWNPRILTSALLLAISVPGCAKHPVTLLEHQAKRYDRQAERKTAEVSEDRSYFVPVADVVASAAADLSTGNALAEVSNTAVGTDWAYGGEVGIDTSGEYFDQRRSRNIVKISLVGPEAQVAKVDVTGERRIKTKGAPTPWADKSAPREAAELQKALGALEARHLSTPRAAADDARILADFEAALPPGYSVSERTNTTLAATAVTTTRKERKGKGLWATWEARTVLQLNINPDDHLITVTERSDHRFTTEAEKGAWSPANTHNQAAALDWLAASLRIGMPAGHEAYSDPLLATIAPLSDGFAATPAPPRLRDMNEIAKVIEARAFETGTGNFTVCLDTVLVNPTAASGYDWDLPGITNVLAATTTVSQVADGALGQLNSMADQSPVIGYLVDGAFAYATADTVDRHRAQSIARTTGAVAKWTAAHLPVKPEIAGSVAIGPTLFTLPQADNTLRTDPNVCATADYNRGGTAIQAILWDVDVSYNDAIGSCSASLGTVFNQGISGVPCGWARLYVSAKYNFSFDQIKVVGLPPVE